ncbi:MAG: glycoside hydrolase [Oscillospiraceae bacterium]|nr:glycoside hydrolase [Oscillospiraceae bacterium]
MVAYRDGPDRGALVNAYAYPFIDSALLQSTLPFLSYLTPFTYGFTPAGQLVELGDAGLLRAAAQAGVISLLHLSTLTEQGNFSNELAAQALNDPTVQRTLIDNLAAVVEAKGYQGVDVDFEYIFPQDALSYAAFIHRLAQVFVPLPVVTALAPKTSAAQPGLLYEGHDYGALGAAADYVLLMTYEWGYTYGPPMAVAPLPNVRQVVEYALTEIPAEKIWLGIPAYGYDWTLPFVQGVSRAVSISCQYAVELALEYGAQIQFDAYAQSPWFNYRDGEGREHQVWFEDARSIQAKLALLGEYGLRGAGYWNLMRPFPQNWQVLDAMYRIEDAGEL